MKNHRLASVVILSVVAATWSAACSSSDESSVSGTGAAGSGMAGENGSGASGSGASGSGTGGANGGNGSGGMGGLIIIGQGGEGPIVVNAAGDVYCGDVLCECNDGIDNDNDGVADGFDIECVGPLDNDEGSFATGIPGDNKDPKPDCYFDGDSGTGNDGCQDPSMPSLQCIEFCKPLTANGCDCFGCCEVQDSMGETITVQLGGSCADLDLVDDEDACPRCEQAEECVNECGECELCSGKTLEDLPESCFQSGTGGNSGTGGSSSGGSSSGGTPGYTCDDGAQICSTTDDCDGNDQYCQLGCCRTVILK